MQNASVKEINRKRSQVNRLEVTPFPLYPIQSDETEACPIPKPSSATVLSHFLESWSIAAAHLSNGTSNLGLNVSAILAGKRGISKANGPTFAEHFGATRSDSCSTEPPDAR